MKRVKRTTNVQLLHKVHKRGRNRSQKNGLNHFPAHSRNIFTNFWGSRNFFLKNVSNVHIRTKRTPQLTSCTTCTTFLFTKTYANFDLDLQNVRNVEKITKFTKNNNFLNVRGVRGDRSVERPCYREES